MAVTLGDPQGIGPEVVAKSLRQHTPKYPLVVIGSRNDFPSHQYPEISHVDQIPRHQPGVWFYPVEAGPTVRDLSYEYVAAGIRWALAGDVDALVTAPISKEKWLNSGITYQGHTQLLAETAGVKDYSMFFWSADLKVALYTIHIPLKDVFQHIQRDKICRFVRFLSRHMAPFFDGPYSFLFSGLNPHSGESGYLGREETDVIIPAMEILKAESEVPILGPYPPDVVFIKARETANAVVISWYHDQGLIPFKLLNIHSGVNVTLGLPYIRTSPDHGTAYDIAGKDMGNPSSMTEAVRLAEVLLDRRG